MEYEIDDDPQGLPDAPEGDRDGGLGEHVFLRREPRSGARAPGDRPGYRDAPMEQLGELA
jgi:hypothetical protein